MSAQDESGTAARPSPILLCHASAHMRSQSRACTLADADVDRPPQPHARCNVHPNKGRTVVPAVQEYPLAVPEPTEAEASAVFEEVAPLDAAMPEVALDVLISIAANQITIAVPISVEEAPIAVVQLIALQKAIVELRPASLGRAHRLASVGGPHIAWPRIARPHVASPHSAGSARSARRTGVTGAGTAGAAWSV